MYTIRSKAEKDGFEDDDEAITRVVEGEEATALKNERKALMYKSRAEPRLHSRVKS